MAEFDERIVTDAELAHYGTKRHSGRYPWGSGTYPMQRGNLDFMGQVAAYKKQGFTEKQIAEAMGFESTTELRARQSIVKTEYRNAQAARALKLHDTGMSNSAIGREMGLNESSVRALLDPTIAARRTQLETTANFLKDQTADGSFFDIGKGTENWRGISATKLSTAVAILKEQGYVVHNVQIPQVGRGSKRTTTKVLCPPGTTRSDVMRNLKNIKTAATFSPKDGSGEAPIKPPVRINPDRIAVRHAEEGGGKADGVIYVRPGVPDISLGGKNYAQVRIAVDDTHYLKGMAMYKDDLPAGVDLMFNTGKKNTGNKLDAFKEGADEEGTPWTTLIRRQRTYTDAQGRTRQSVMNIVNEEGSWETWRPSLSSQVLSKQSNSLARQQLDLAYRMKVEELDEIRALTNPVIKKKLLETFGDETDAAAVHLSAAALPRQKTHVILPIEKMREGDVYAPNYNNGERVALIRHPHGGTFEIPVLTVNNRNPTARKMIGTHPVDAIGIHPIVAQRLSGADFDGDAVLVIPNTRGLLKTTPALAGLKNFDPKTTYAPYDGMRTMDGGYWDAKSGTVDYRGKRPSGLAKQQQMGNVSNLITDMTIKGAHPDEIAKAVRHSMVVIDAVNHHLDYKQSEKDNDIALLKERYQGKGRTGRLKGASTIVSRAGSEERIPERRPRSAAKGGPINPPKGTRGHVPDLPVGAKVYEPTGRMIPSKKGGLVPKMERTTKLAEELDARRLVSDERTPMELIYADHSNSLKALANQARAESLQTGKMYSSPSARKAYAPEVKRLNAALNLAQRNAPLERQAQIVANAMVRARTQGDRNIDPDELKKIQQSSLKTARARVGAHKDIIEISDREWEAIQAGAITGHKLREIINNSNQDRLKKLATPRTTIKMTPNKVALARLKLAAGFTQAEVAQSLGVSVSTLNRAMSGEGEG